jgi:hypothetical protein
MSPWRLVATSMVRIYRPIVLAFVLTVAVGDLIGVTVISWAVQPGFSLWVMIFGTGARYWLGIVGVMVVAMHLRQFIANGITRRDFTRGAGVAGLVLAVLLAALVPIGHALEMGYLHLIGVAARYPDLTVGLALSEFGHTLASGLAFLVSGLAVTAGFYRFGGWPGLVFLLPGLVPLGVAESLLSLGEQGRLDTRLVPNAQAVLITLAATAVIAVLYRLLTRDVPIRRTAG